MSNRNHYGFVLSNLTFPVFTVDKGHAQIGQFMKGEIREQEGLVVMGRWRGYPRY